MRIQFKPMKYFKSISERSLAMIVNQVKNVSVVENKLYK